MLVFLFTLLFATHLSSQCEIWDLVVEPYDCSDDFFMVDIDFNYDEVGVSGFELTIQGLSYGTYEYTDLPITVGDIPVDCLSEFEFQVNDVDDPNCVNSVILDPPCCDCEFWSIDFNLAPYCEEDQVWAEWIIFGENFSGEGISVYVNDVFLDNFDYEDSDTYFFGFDDPETDYFTLEICDLGAPDCCSIIEHPNPCYEEVGECEIWDLIAEPYACEDDVFYVDIDFNYDNVGSSGFTIMGNGTDYGTFEYADLPITLGTLSADCETNYEFVVKDVDDPACQTDTEIGIQCCEGEECNIFDAEAASIECIDGPLVLVTDFSFEYENVTNDLFDLYIDGDFDNYYSYTNLPITFEFEADVTAEFFTITICDNDNEDCCSEFTFENPCYEESEECDITAFDFGDNPECDGELIVTDWLIDGVNLSEVGFDIYVNDEFELFVEYEDDNWYDFDLEDPGTEVIVVKVCDNDNGDCCAEIEFENPCYEEGEECELWDLVVEPYECSDGFFMVDITFEYDGVGDSGFTVMGNGVTYGTYEYGDLPITIGNLEADCETNYEFIIKDVDNPDCQVSTDIGEQCCEGEECNIFDAEAASIECIDGPIVLVTDFSFEYENVTNDLFDLYIDGDFDDYYSYTNLPITFEFEADVTAEFFTITICDNDNEDCCSEFTFENPCYEESEECDITAFDFGDNPECDGELIVTDWLIDGVNLSEVGFDIYVNDEFELFVEYEDDNWYDFDLEDPGTEVIVVKVCDNDNGDCCAEIEFENPCYEEGEECELWDLVVEPYECSDGFFMVDITFEYDGVGDSGFTVMGNGVTYGTYEYGDLPITIGNLEADCETNYEFIIKDVDNPDCQVSTDIGEQCCEGEECNIFDAEAASIECIDGPLVLVTDFSFEYENVTNDLFDLYIDGDFDNYYSYTNLPITFEFEADVTAEFFTITICDNDNEDCCSEFTFENPCYEESEECDITAFDFGDNPECDGELIVTDWLIDGVNLSEVGFDIYVNDEFELFVEYEDDNWYDFDLEDPGTEVIVVKVCDNDNGDCCAEIEFENPCYEEGEECELWDLVVEPYECSDGFFMVDITFEYDGVGDSGFTVMGNGVTYGTYEYGDLPITIGNLEADCETNYEFIIKDVDNPDCQVSTDIGEQCCEGEECNIFDAEAASIECIDGPIVLVTDFSFEYENVTNDLFDLYIDGDFDDYYSYTNLPITFEFEADVTAEFFTITICDNDNEDCCSEFTFENPCYEESEECDITAFDFGDNPECDGELIVTDWLIDGVNLSEVGFDIYVNDEFELFVEYEDDNWYDFDLEDPGTEVIVVKVCDNDNGDCCAEIEFENPCYTSSTVEDELNKDMLIYNFVDGRLILELRDISDISFRVSAVDGRSTLSGKLYAGQNIFDFNGNNGVYLLTVWKSSNPITLKIIKL